MKKQKRRSISTAIVSSFTALILVVTAVIVGRSYAYTTEQLQSNAIDYTQQLIAQVNAELDMYVEHIIDISDFIVNNGVVSTYLDTDSSAQRRVQTHRVEQILRNASDIRRDISVVALVDRDGRVLFGDASAHLNPHADYQNAVWFQSALAAQGKVSVSSSRVENLVDGMYQWVVSFSKSVGDGPDGVLLVDLSYDVIDDICANIQLGKRGYIFLVDASGDILWHPQQNLINNNLKSENIADLLAQGDNAVLRTTAEGEKLYISNRSISTGWTAVGVASPEDLLQNQDLLFRQYALIGVLAVTLACLIAMLISRAITNPLRKLTATMQQVEQGDLSVRCTVKNRNEVGQLSENFNHMISTTQDLMAEQLRSHEQKRLSEWKVLQAQIKPHFLYNTLDSIIWMSHAGKNEQVVEMTSALAQLLRNSIGSGKEIITLAEELRHVESYLVIQKMRYNEKLQYELDIDPKTADCTIPRLVLQPLVENAIYHGIKVKEDGGEIFISAMLDDEQLLVTVEDNGPGMTPEQLAHIFEQKESDETSSKIGIYNVHERLRIHFGEDFGLKFFSEPDKGTTAMLILPIHYQEEEVADEPHAE